MRRQLVFRARGLHRVLCRLGLHAWEIWMEYWSSGSGRIEQGRDYRQCAVCGKRRRQ